MQNFNLNKVEDKSDDCDHEHFAANDLRRREETEGRLDEEPHCHDPDRCHRDHRANDLCTVPAIGQVIVRTFLTKAKGKD